MAESNESRFILSSSSFSYQTSHFGFLVAVKKIKKRREKENQLHRDRLLDCSSTFIGQGIRRMSSAFKIPIKDKSRNTLASATHTQLRVSMFAALLAGMNDASLMHLSHPVESLKKEFEE
jgi:chromatin segregation and condensation protein Rec8/ScpA/Scc1 (kleisin family)